ncbi:Na+/H+ antiporter NhaA [Rhodobacter capsulatus]|uniref:Na(+)/H(+) antiporter NhaA n=1 Tax=Rhodobacter capsulatus TaxID=1061 RepID=A0A1G7IHP9_RHOCA|nr:Na+/H+ antiporter NhaA [Rhodobacter capsulatus]PZX25752.1 NhaA family Na+:H+ antiporter [Rhodobacter capsulatus]QNR64054.1 Na+/H+ antiporter NhaA [Rhodobacter capsulatus]WER10223.1 Na+/H+ antiporter NhaA [Rhodobacter capsulatus]SDF12173.1 Na+:H+ antiporter, NhaA family [Rhodobacter capsulatus]
MLRRIETLFAHEAAGGIMLILATVVALILANSELAALYTQVLHLKFTVALGETGLSKPLILWINDGLMAIFFLLVGLELKHELRAGRLKTPSNVVLPGVAALGGMIAPALIYLAFTWSDPLHRTGWAIPTATDIAFAVGVVALLGPRVPPALKLFLLTLAILDDLGAILVIALFYTATLKPIYLALALIPIALMALRLWFGAHRIAPTLILGAVLWVLVLKSGVHATLAGVITAFFLPIRDRFGKSPLHALEHGLAPYVAFLIVPIFALANAGVNLSGLGLADLAAPLPLAIALGLVVGKQLGVFGATFALVKLGFARLPEGTGWLQLYGISALAGIGFTMSLFIGSLNFETDVEMNAVRLGVLAGSLVSALMGFAVLRLAPLRAEPAR